jgi:Ni/Co efflux regulator RcnB
MRKTLLSLTAIAVLAVPGVAQARHGADDSAGHVRHAAHHVRHHHARHHHARHHHARHHARGADDAAGHARGGADDGANHR